jgi:hypothetical protein
MALQLNQRELTARLDALRENEPDPFKGTPEEVEAYVVEVRDILDALQDADTDLLNEAQRHYLNEAAAHQVRFAHGRLEKDRHNGLETLRRLFRLGKPAQPDGRYEGELVALSTGLLSDPFFEWMTRIYLPWLGKTFDRAAATGDNVFSDNAWSKATEKFGWPEYRIANPDGTVRVFPFRTYVAPGIEDPDLDVLKIDYHEAPNPLPVRRIVDELVELPGGYYLGKAHMRGLREFRRVCFFGLFKP